MAKLSTYIYAPNTKGVVNIAIRLTHKGKRKFFSVASCSEADIDKKGRIKNNKIRHEVDSALDEYTDKLLELSNIEDSLSCDDVYERVFVGENNVEEYVDFIKFYRHVIELKKKANPESGTYRRYVTSLQNLIKYCGDAPLDINEITKSWLVKYLDWLKKTDLSSSTIIEYMDNHACVHNMAKMQFNDEEAGIVLVKYSPFQYVKTFLPKKKEVEHIALPKETIKAIYELPDSGRMQANQGRDIFLLSFFLCGMNMADMMEVEGLNDEGKIDYHRKKTRNTTGEGSRIVISIPDIAKPIVEKYKGKKRLFDFSERFHCDHNVIVKKYIGEMTKWLKEYYSNQWNVSESEVVKRLKLPETLKFYSARHSWATIAANECRIPIEIVDRCLCHSVKSVALNTYVRIDYSFVDDANSKVIEETFGCCGN